MIDLSVLFLAPPPKPIKDRPPPPTPEVYPHTRPEVSNVTRDMFTKPTADTDVPSGDKASEKSDEVEYALQLAGLVENYREVVNNLTKKQPRGPSILTKEWLVRLQYVCKITLCGGGGAVYLYIIVSYPTNYFRFKTCRANMNIEVELIKGY